MELDAKCKVERVISGDSTRYDLTSAYLDCKDEQAKLIATNGRAMAVINVKADKAEAGTVPVEVFSEARRIAPKRVQNIQIHLDGAAKLDNGATFERAEVNFPDWRQIISSTEHDKPVFHIALSVSILADLIAAMGATQNIAYIDFYGTDKPMKVRVADNSYSTNLKDDRFGVLIPVAWKQDDAEPA